MTPPVFRDHFSGHSSDYGRFRPTYPPNLFDWLATQVPQSTRVWDCATGNGQAARALAEHFRRVHATDASEKQIAAAPAHPGVHYAVRPASDSGLEAHSVGLVTIAQALHWFEPAPFHAELRRVLEPGGLVVAWCYELFTVSEAFDIPMLQLYHDVLGTDWPPERRHVETGYSEISWPWERLDAPALEMVQEWSLEQTLGYMRTWSAAQRFAAREGSDPVERVEAVLQQAWGEAPTRRVSWPLKLLVSRL